MRVSLATLLIALALPVAAQDITGDLNTNIGAGANVDSNNVSNSSSTTYNGPQGALSNPVPSAMAPTMMSQGSDSCLIPSTSGIQVSLFGIAKGEMEQDPACNTRKNARLLGTPQAVGGLGLQVAGISVLCQEPSGQVFKAMALANTPCPIMDVDTGQLLIGRAAYEKMRAKPFIYIPFYANDMAFWNTLLAIGRDLADVQTNDDRPTLSERFRCNSAGSDLCRTGGRGQPDNEPDQPVTDAGGGG